MTASIFLDELTGRGVTLEAAPGGLLRCKPRSALSPNDIANLKRYKRELLELVVPKAKQSAVTTVTAVTMPRIADTYRENGGDRSGDSSEGAAVTTVTTPVPEFVREAEERASRLGLVARWAMRFGYVGIHDPTSGEWHDLRVGDAPPWAVREARKRKALWGEGETLAYEFTAGEMEEIWESERPVVEERPLEGWPG